MNYCIECGFKLEGEFKFCPNCGSSIASSNSLPNDQVVNSNNVVVCKNCGEENPSENSSCFSCGILLNDRKSSSSEKRIAKKSSQKNSTSEKITDKKNSVNEEKVLDNKKILIISSVVLLVFIIALIATGVFDSGVQSGVTQVKTQSQDSGVNMANMKEITDLEIKLPLILKIWNQLYTWHIFYRIQVFLRKQ